MNFKNTYNEPKDRYLFGNSKKFLKLRNNITNEYPITPKIKKNNESLKHLDPRILEFKYKYKDKIPNDIISYKNIDEENRINIKVIDGKISVVEINLKQKIDIIIQNINDTDYKTENDFIEFQKFYNKDYIVNLNSLYFNSGYKILIGENQKLNIFITNLISENELTIFQKNLIYCSKKSEVKIVEDFFISDYSNINLFNHIKLKEHSELIYLTCQKNSDNSKLQATSYANCDTFSKYRNLVLNISDSSSRNHHYANMLGENTSASLDGIFFGSKKQFIDNKTQINHNFPNCISSQRYKGVLTDSCNASYLSKTFVNKIAQKTEAYQLSKGILLSDNSYFHSKPELKIFADDVKCSHGSTIGPIDKDLLFYLRSRGLTNAVSTSLLIKSFFHDIISDGYDKNFTKKFYEFSSEWLEKNVI